MVSLADLKKTSSTEKLNKAMEKKTYASDDNRYWQPTVDKAGNGGALIRFLDTPKVDADKDNALPFVQIWSHSFKGPTGQYYIENSLTTLGEDDPVSEMNTALWATGIDSNKKIASERKRKLTYVSNILVINDPGNPANNGKVFLYKYGMKIYDKIRLALKPDTTIDPDAVGVNVFDFWKGANFKLMCKNVAGGDGKAFRNYDDSVFSASSPVGDDEKIESLWNQSYSLLELIDRKHFKTYAELKARLDKVVPPTNFVETTPSTPSRSVAPKSAADLGESDLPASRPALKSNPDNAFVVEDDDYFAKLAAGDDSSPF